MLDQLGLKRVTLDLPFRLDHVNCFLAEGANGWTVIDAGLHNEETIKRWDEELSGKDVNRIIITHYHPDHFGYAGGLQAKLDSSVYMTETDYKAAENAWDQHFLNELETNYELAGIPEDEAEKMLSNTKAFVPIVTPFPKVDHYFKDGETVRIGAFDYEVIATPGHSDGLVTFYNRDKNTLLSTDHILPKITPNISYWFHGDPNPLGSYLDSLDRIKQLDAAFVIPSHGDPFHGANDRINEIKAHHADRLDETLEALGNGGTVYQVCQQLFKKELTVHEMRFAVGETLAHLEYLRYRKACKRALNAGKYWYQL
ncbi:Glyoxylase, beta-lactamase superfamily II [Lentibacillus persicus]|uniref:Glyoxylase, beta-lactamase superfamily II n=1 Tax=Lentibacillus persicus TaxID=640948 RepID=A0A1I1YND2_9BACI|nr:MBL fold metallo-hydrolase [Lentibacillus persicus]SFE21046.1 Glyoxylase, beta-lactamase superfamily II [Lentibacillus persicus]